MGPREAIEPEGIIFFCLFCSLFTLHSSLFCSLFTALLSPVIAEKLIQNCQLNQLVVRSAPVFALYLQELQ